MSGPDPDSALRYDAEVDPASDSTHAKIVRLVGTGKRVLELGCATGSVSRVLQENGCEVVGVEIDPEAAKRASAFCEEVIVGDLDSMRFAEELGDHAFDVILAADVLEHLKRPAAVIDELRAYLGEGGYLVVSVPNIAHGSVRLALLEGAFVYSETGLLDRSHLRFFTRDSLTQMLADGGYVLVQVEDQRLGVGDSEVSWARDELPEGVLAYVERDPESLVYQFIGVAFPVPDPQRELISPLLAHLAEEREASTGRLAEMQARLDAMAKTEGDLQELLAQREADLRESAEARADLETRIDQGRADDAARLTELEGQAERLGLELLHARDELFRGREELDRVSELLAGERTARQKLEASRLRAEAERDRELERRLAEAERDLAEAHGRLALAEESAQRSGAATDGMRERAEAAQHELAEIHSSKLWRWGQRYRQLLGRLR